MKRIVVDPPHSEARRDRVERELFERLAAVRTVDRADAVIPRETRRRAPLVLAAAGLAAAAAVAIIVAARDPAPATPVTTPVASPSRIVTPVGGTSQLELPGALVEARSDTSVEIQHGEAGAITLVIARGAVECDVEPRHGRPPFRVLAGDTTVEVVGTRFTVTRTPRPRVDVARGTVRVTSPSGTWLVNAGDTWPPPADTASAPPPAPAGKPELEVAEPAVVAAPVEPARSLPTEPPAPSQTTRASKPAQTRERVRESYRIALKLESTDPQKAIRLYRAIATDGKGMEPVALVSLAELQLELGAPGDALAALDELARRFPKAANIEDAAWLRYEALRAMGKHDQARGVAAEYLRKFPHGAYADRMQDR